MYEKVSVSLETRRKLLYALLASFASFCSTQGRYLPLVEWNSRDVGLLARGDWRAALGPCNPNVWESPGQGHLWGNHLDYLIIPAATATHSIVALGSLPRHTCHLEAQAHFSQITPGTVFTAMPPSENWLHWLSMFLRFLLVLMHRRQFLLFGPSMVLKHIPFFLGILSEKVRLSLLFNPPFEPKDMIRSQ